MKITRAREIHDVLIIEPTEHADVRGRKLDTFLLRELTEVTRSPLSFVDIHISYFVAWSLSGLTYQNPQPQGRLITPISGRLQSVAVDLRDGSPTYGKHVSTVITDNTFKSVWVPPGFAHGFLALGTQVSVMELCTSPLVPEWTNLLNYNDPDLVIQWMIKSGHNPTMNTRERSAPGLSSVTPIKLG